jgi:shikimate kinase
MALPKPLRLALIGMSGSGKTLWTNRLAEAALPKISCDERIEKRLRRDLEAGGLRGIGGVAAWMGWPDHPAYPEREAKYLEAEIGVMNEVLDTLERDASRELVLDTTGSVIYTGDAIRERLRQRMTVVYLAASAEEQTLLVERYLNDPKPVLWRDSYRPLPGEPPRETVARCYPVLIERRRKLYENYAHCTLAIRELHGLGLDARGLLTRIETEMSRRR